MSSLNIALALKQLPLLLDQLQDSVDELLRLKVLDDPSDIEELVSCLDKIVKVFQYIDSELVYNLKEFLKYKTVILTNLDNYKGVIQLIESHNDDWQLPLTQYKIDTLKCLTQEQEQQLQTPKPKKVVRFKESLIDPPSSSVMQSRVESEQSKALKLDLFQTSSLIDDDVSSHEDDLSNRQIFINNQQELLQQDTMLDTLSTSIRTQRDMGLSINDELEDHLIILNDLELMIDGTSVKLSRGQKRVNRVNEKIRENSSWITILVLLFILILLLII